MTAADAAYEALRREILMGVRTLGERLGEVEIARELRVSRTPTREALRRLEADGLVEITPQRGARVVSPTREDLIEIFDLRENLETTGAAAAAVRIAADQLEELRHLAEELETLSVQPRDPALELQRAENNSRFHDLILISAGRPRLRELANSLMLVPIVAGTFQRYTARDLERAARHHTEIVEALSAGDGTWAASVMRSHIRAARYALIR